MGAEPDYAAQVAGLSNFDLAGEIAAAYPGAGGDEVLAALAEHGPEQPLGINPAAPRIESIAEHVVFVSRLAGHLGLTVTKAEE
jgi:hypothetical protein